ncbi:hypothetical protein EOD41_12410 [Mucilaginibacter limnophilus]|uniref:DUF262 domain-containing protein n=1 Tax=Mucilaginibacter limnophilus TaxID=1932778 RepID=A0A437MRK3_9SPHI|nr:hypothetical protein [Mucilaginibacter limnophilus]RVU00280.1 hypothetical protein EOD41_12410 [Mucilaginibacter limnophilus]
MKIRSILYDQRITAYNALVEISIGEYLSFAEDIIDKNEFQRKRVIRSKIKEILQEDLLRSCLIPSIVLAIPDEKAGTINDEDDFIGAERLINKAVQIKDILIIDGLQRTFVMMGLAEDLKKQAGSVLENFYAHRIRAEIYLGLNRIGLLYRMITLNTGQTTMSTRHLMEILYIDYSRIGIEGINIVKDKDENLVENNTTSFNFKTILDGLNSYIEKNEAIIERVEILDNIRSLDALKLERDDKDLFKEFLLTHKVFLETILTKSNQWAFTIDKEESAFRLNSQPFGKTPLDIFKKSQAITGFGAAVGFLKQAKNISLSDVRVAVSAISTDGDDWDTAFRQLLKQFDLIKEKSKKIGNDQRYYFKYFFRSLLNPEADEYLNFSKAALFAYDNLRVEKEYK